jgi:hypothetical protein
MDLFTFLVITIILCSLIMVVLGGEGKAIKFLGILSIAVEVLYILWVRGAVDLPLGFDLKMILPCITGAVGLIGLFKLQERSVPLLVFFASLLQFFMETSIIESLR